MYHNIHYKYYTYTLTEPHHWHSAVLCTCCTKQERFVLGWQTHISFFDHICVRTILTHMHRLLLEDLALALMKVLSLCLNPLLPHLISGGDM